MSARLRLRQMALTAVCIGALASCAEIGASPIAAPGTQPANPVTAGRLFATGCLANLPDFAGTGQAVAGQPLTLNTSNGTLFHNTQNLSLLAVQLPGNTFCKVTFGTTQSRRDATFAFFNAANSAVPGVQADIDVTFANAPDGLTYITATLDAQ